MTLNQQVPNSDFTLMTAAYARVFSHLPRGAKITQVYGAGDTAQVYGQIHPDCRFVIGPDNDDPLPWLMPALGYGDWVAETDTYGHLALTYHHRVR